MKLVEADAKQLLRHHGLTTPPGRIVDTADAAAVVAIDLGPCVVKAQVPTGGRGKAGGVVLCENADEARRAAADMLGSTFAEHHVTAVLVEAKANIAAELYASIVVDTSLGTPVAMVSPAGGVDIEDNASTIVSLPLTPGHELSSMELDEIVTAIGHDIPAMRDALSALHRCFTQSAALLVEINPLVVTEAGDVVALDAKVDLDDSGPDLPFEPSALGAEMHTELEVEAAERGLRLIEIGGNVAILANGAGLTMTTMDAVAHHGGRPANFLEIGGDAYTLAEPALELTLRQPDVRSLLVNFCGAFARCDVMTEGVVNALESLRPKLDVFFSIHGTGQDEARAMVRDRLGLEPYESMDDAVIAAVEAAR